MNSHFAAPLVPHHSPAPPGVSGGTPLLVFRLGAARLALPALAVREVHMLPLLSPLPQSAPFVVGIFDLRGAIVPVIDLNARLGQISPPPRPSDALILVDWNGATRALLVNEVLAVNHLATSPHDIAPSGMLSQGANPGAASVGASFVAGVTRIEGEIVLLLDLARLLDFSLSDADSAKSGGATQGLEPNWTPAERETLQMRALRLREAARDESLVEAPNQGFEAEASGRETHAPVAVFALGGEEFALPLALVREFAWVASVASVPCCPPHILGQINLRGDIVTLLDVRHTLHTARTTPPFFKPRAEDFSRVSPISANANADQNSAATVPIVVVQHEGEGVGLAVDEVRDVLYLRSDAWSALDNAPQGEERGKASRHRFFAGGATYQGRLLPFLDIGRLLDEGGLEVNETP